MKTLKGLYIFILAIICSLNSFSQEKIVLTGVFKGQPLYIQNPYHPGLESFCINFIYINDKAIDLNFNLSAFKLSLSNLDLYTPVKIEIDHKDVCNPVIINKDAILFHSSFKFMELFLSDTVMSWTTKGDRPGAVFEIEKLYSDGWSQVETVNSSGKFEGSDYQYFPEFDEGSNKYRLKYKINNDRYLYSSELELEYYPVPVELISKTVGSTLNLNRVSDYRIENNEGDVMLTGTAKIIDVSGLKAGEYYIIIEDLAMKFLKNTK